MFKKFRHWVFWPPFVLLLVALLLSIANAEKFLQLTTKMNQFIVDKLGWWFSGSTLFLFILCFLLYVSPLGKVKIGGTKAKPLLSRWQWFSIILCTTIATGIIFWGTAEPLFHLQSLPQYLSHVPKETHPEYALSLVYLHWSFTPYAIYCIPAVAFALAFYNHRQPFSIQSTLFPLGSKSFPVWLGILIDGLCLFALIAGMSASLGAGILTLSGGIAYLTGIESKGLVLILTLFIVLSFVLSAASGLKKGIRILSDINVKIFVALAILAFFIFDPLAILRLSYKAVYLYIVHFFDYSTLAIQYPNDPWPKSWTTFNWANWLAWAPITALFLGKIGYGYSVRQFLLFNWLLPSIFGILWMSIFSGISIEMVNQKTADLLGILNLNGAESVIYSIFEALPFSKILAFVFLFVAYLSYVTAADSNTEALSSISATGIQPGSPAPPLGLKIAWGIVIGAVAYTMLSMAGLNGIKMLSNLGGVPSLIIISAASLGMLKLAYLSFLNKNE